MSASNSSLNSPRGSKKSIDGFGKIEVKSKVGSLDNIHHTPKGGDKKIFSTKLDFKEKAAAKVGSIDNLNHVPGGGKSSGTFMVFLGNLLPSTPSTPSTYLYLH